MYDSDYQEILKSAYLRASTFVNMYAYPKEVLIDVRTEITRQIDKALLVSQNIYFTDGEKDNILIKSKSVYKEYCAFIKAHPEENTEQLIKRADQLVCLMVKLESEMVTRFTRSLKEDQNLDLEKVFSIKHYVKELLNHSALYIIQSAIKGKTSESTKEYPQFFTTKSGKRYHIQSCSYCKGKMLCSDIVSNYFARRIAPCKCVIKARNREIEDRHDKEQQSHYMTAYVDESIRLNPAYLIDKEQERYQNLLSIILCKGKVKKEELISKENTMASFISIGRRTASTSDTTVEAIGTVLLKVAASGFEENLIVYTDNDSACKTWKTKKELQLLSRVFKSVQVIKIKRDRNTQADALIRQNDIMLLPRLTMDKVVDAYNMLQIRCK